MPLIIPLKIKKVQTKQTAGQGAQIPAESRVSGRNFAVTTEGRLIKEILFTCKVFQLSP